MIFSSVPSLHKSVVFTVVHMDCSVHIILPCFQSRDDLYVSSLSYSNLVVCCDGKEASLVISLELMMVFSSRFSGVADIASHPVLPLTAPVSRCL